MKRALTTLSVIAMSTLAIPPDAHASARRFGAYAKSCR